MKLVFFTFLLWSLTSWSQDKHFYKNTIIQVQGNVFETQHYNSPQWYSRRQNSGCLISASTDLVSSPNFRLDIQAGYRFVDDYANPDAFHIPGDHNNSYFNYHGGVFGLGFNIGRRHNWEVDFISGFGAIRKPRQEHNFAVGEMGFQTGYLFISKKGLVLRSGVAIDLARNGFFSNAYSGYVGVGYALQREQGTVSKVKEEYIREKGYFNVHLSPFIGSISEDLVGMNFGFDHLVYNGHVVDMGYGVSARIGASWGANTSGFSGYYLMMVGKKRSKFECSLGPSIHYENGDVSDWAAYNFVHFGLGYRFVANQHFMFRVGTATTAILHMGVGVKF